MVSNVPKGEKYIRLNNVGAIIEKHIDIGYIKNVTKSK